jgi:CYTH domain-containing protein
MREHARTCANMAGMADRTPGEGRYAQVEREQRWLVPSVPADVKRIASIHDRYILGTRLRLRQTESENGTTYKFCQKVRRVRTDPMTVKITNMYLSANEYATLSALPAAELSKTRWLISVGERDLAIDEFRGRHAGLVLAEVELGETEELWPMPTFASQDVTHNDDYSGGTLAFATDDQLVELFRGNTKR